MRLVVCLVALVLAGDPGEVRVALDHGRLRARDLFAGVYEALGLEAPKDLDRLHWTIDVGSALGKLQLQMFDRIAPGVMTTEAGPDQVVIRFDPAQLQARRRQIDDSIAAWVDELVEARPAEERFGLFVVTPVHPRAGLEKLPPQTSRAVVLVHGLDEPGWIWRDLIPELLGVGHTLLRFEYPNDQPIAESADSFATWLGRLRDRGVARIDVVAHSMGGLVARDVLTRRAYYGGDGTGGEHWPAIDRLVMLGTPNNGSKMARLRAVGELREQIVRLFSREASWRDALADGAGEAGEDLLPDSVFLRDLNARPLASHTRYTIAAGRLSPVSQADVEALAQRIRKVAESRKAPKWLRAWAGANEAELADSLQGAIRGLGDGVVTIDSARLKGVDDVVLVEANHLSMLMTLTDSMPPAIPIVLDRLHQQSDDEAAPAPADG